MVEVTELWHRQDNNRIIRRYSLHLFSPAQNGSKCARDYCGYIYFFNKKKKKQKKKKTKKKKNRKKKNILKAKN